MNNLKDVLQLIKSDKVKERQEGLSSLRTVFAQDKVVSNFHITRDGKSDPRAWLAVFQAVFQAIFTEKDAYKKKAHTTTATTITRRLGEASSCLRWLVERSVTYMNKRVVKAVLEHIMKTMVYDGRLFAPIAADYVKALRCLLDYRPHVEHLDDQTWISIVEMAFNVVLGDPIKKNLDEPYSHDEEQVDELADDSMFADDSVDETNDELGTPGPSPSKKRKRSQSAAPSLRSQSQAPGSLNFQRRSSRQPPVTTEQIEFMAIVSILLASPNAPFLSSEYPYLAEAILHRLQRFIEVYPSDTSLHYDYLVALSATLSQLALNRKRDVENFAGNTWIGLVGLWGTKNKALKEGLVAILTVLLPYYTVGKDVSWMDGLRKLWNLLDGEGHNKWGIDTLMLEALRLEVSGGTDSTASSPFIAQTFRSGNGFDAGQALAWAILELQADIAAKLFHLSESVSVRTVSKRSRFDNPLSSLLSAIQKQIPSSIRSYRLQLLLFFVSRHWTILHRTFKHEVVNTLLQFISFDDTEIQSWVYLCLAAIAYAEGFSSTSDIDAKSFDDHEDHQIHWDPIWTHAMRRASVPLVCRAACHVAYILLIHSINSPATIPPQLPPSTHQLLPSQQVLSEIEVLVKDLDVQGPSLPYDSVCMFLAECLKVASQDVGLYRMQLEEKVLSWLVDCWKIRTMASPASHGRRTSTSKDLRIPIHTLSDMMILLESICGLTKRNDFVCPISLPECWIANTLTDQARARVIRDFLLDARLPPFERSVRQHSMVETYKDVSQEIDSLYPIAELNEAELIQPRSRDRKLSAFFVKELEGLAGEWDAAVEDNGYASAEAARYSTDFAAVAFCYEFVLNLNGIRPNRRAVQLACKVFTSISSWLTSTKWSFDERAYILCGLEPLWDPSFPDAEYHPWTAMLPPEIGSGIRFQVLRTLIKTDTNPKMRPSSVKEQYQRIVWKSADVQDTFGNISSSIRDLLRIIVGELPSDSRSLDYEDRDGFGAVQTVTSLNSQVYHPAGILSSMQQIVKACMTFLAFVPILQSASAEATRDKDLTDLVLNCASPPRSERFLLVCPAFLTQVRFKTLNFHANSLDAFLDRIAELLEQYTYSRSERLQYLLIQLLDSTLHVWLTTSIMSGEVGGKVRQLCEWLSNATKKKKFGSWRVRDSLTCFLDRCISLDPLQKSWLEPAGEGKGSVDLPITLLPIMGSDEDTRVRFRAAVVNARLFAVARIHQQSPLAMYNAIKEHLTVDLSNYEHMLTRILSLGNTMVISSAVRRGAYWHLLETCLHSDEYSGHIKGILSQVAQRMGLPSLSDLFQAYASQLAYSICQGNYDFLRFPPHLLGYRDRRESAEAAFRAFTPTNLLSGTGSHNHGLALFNGHCKVIQKSIQDGIQECFSDIIGMQVVAWFDENNEQSPDQLEDVLREKTQMSQDATSFEALLRQNTDGIITAVLRTLGDQDFAQDGPLRKALENIAGSKPADEFFELNRYRTHQDFATHNPNLPMNPASRVLQALIWLDSRLRESQMSAITFHVLHTLLSDIEKSPLVNEQIRLANALTLWVAFRSEHFRETALLHTLTQGAASLMTQPDMARVAQSVLEWNFNRYRNNLLEVPCLCDILIRLCHQAHNYSREGGNEYLTNEYLTNLGNDLLVWIHGQASLFARSPIHRKDVIRALPAWSGQLSPELTQLYHTINAETLSGIIADHRISSNKFRLVRRLQELAVDGDSNDKRFSSADFWRLKDCIPSAEQLHDEDIHAFAGLTVLHKGRVDGIGVNHPDPYSVRTKHRLGALKTSFSKEWSAQNSILFALVTLLGSDDSSQVHSAYATLRLLVSSSPIDVTHLNSWPNQYIQTLEYLKACLPHPRQSTARSLAELTTDPYLDASAHFPRWITGITTLLSDILASRVPFYAQLVPMLTSNSGFAEQLLPVLVLAMLQSSLDADTFRSNRQYLTDYFTATLKARDVAIRCLSAVIDVVLHLRFFSPPNKDALGYDKWLGLDYTLLAKSCITCGAYTTALLFLELGSEYSNTASPDDAETILFEIYSHIDEPDGFYGIKTNDLRQFLIRRFHHEGQWEKAFHFHGAASEAKVQSQSTIDGLLRSYHAFGFNRLAISTLQSSLTGMTGSSMSYRLGWRTETWDLPDRVDGIEGASVYSALRSVYREREPRAVKCLVRRAMLQEMDKLRSLGIENHAEIHEVIQNLVCLYQVAFWTKPETQRLLMSKRIDYSLESQFANIQSEFDFADLENLMSTRISLIRSARQKEERSQIGTVTTPFIDALLDLERTCLLHLSEAARQAHQGQVALNAITRAQYLGATAAFPVQREFANVLWLQKEQKAAVQLLRDILLDKEANVPSQKPTLLAQLGSWTAEACLEKPMAIVAKYFSPAASLIESMKTASLKTTHTDVYHQYATFSEHQYRTILKSSDDQRLQAYIKLKEEEMDARKKVMDRLDPISKQREVLETEQRKAETLQNADKQLLAEHNKARDSFLIQAIDMYARCLASSTSYDDDGVLRLASLWFANFDAGDLQDVIDKALSSVPSYKLVFLAHQLTARLSKPQSGHLPRHQAILQELILRMCREHPYHSLYQVYCLQPQIGNTSFTASASRRSSGRHSQPVGSSSTQTERSAAASAVMDILRNDPSNADRVRSIEQLCNASVQWAQYPLDENQKRKGRQLPVPKHLLISKISNLRVPVITAHLPPDPTMRYQDCVWVNHFDNQFSLAGGLNWPKITDCIGTNGEKYKQLYKGGDDLRQDAVMEQVFQLVNVVLRRDRETKRRALRVRGYKIIPLGPQAGVFEFVGNTTPLASWLNTAHVTYRPQDLTPSEAFHRLKALHQTQENQGSRVERMVPALRNIRERFKPVMRHWFTEQHKMPTSWFAVRLRYTRSVATTSIVGHLLGLGDRHTSNILIDKVSGEVVHIDLGVAFEQGKLLKAPEVVPFRMTPDMVDGMGITGTQGVFQRCAEETLRVLRDGSQIIMTVLEVFKHDPLYSWTVSESKLQRVQASEGETNEPRPGPAIGIQKTTNLMEELADRALNSVARKLDKSLSVEYTINQLIAEATDINNLAVMYYGWSPHM